MEKKFESYAQLLETAETEFNESSETFAALMKLMADTFRQNVAMAADLPVERHQEESKRDTIVFWRSMANHFDLLAVAIRRQPVGGSTITKEVFDALVNGWKIKEGTPMTMEEFFLERARNIAGMYQFRLLPE